MFVNIPKDILERLEKNPNTHESKPADFPRGDLDGENFGSYSIYTDPEERISIITVPPTDKFAGGIYVPNNGRNFLFFTQSKINVAVTFTNPDGTIQIFELLFNTAEAAFQAAKASVFRDVDAFEKIYYAETPGDAKKLGNQVKGFKDAVWKYKAPRIVSILSAMKLEQCSDVKEFLLSLVAHAAKHNIPFPSNVRVFESKEDVIYGTGLDHKDTVQKIVDAVVAGDAATLHEKLLSMEQDVKLTGQRHACPEQYPLTGFFPGQDWMGCGITRAIKEYYTVAQKDLNADFDPRSPKKARTHRSDSAPPVIARTGSSSSAASQDKGDAADSTVCERSFSRADDA